VGTFLAMTNNGEVNVVLAQRAAEEFQPPRVLAVFPRDPQASAANNGHKVAQAFMPELPLKTWNEYLSNDAVKLGETRLRDEDFAFQQAHLQALIRSGELLPLLLERDQRLQIMPAQEAWEAGDRIIYLLHDPRPKLLKLLSGATQPRLTVEKLAAVEEVPMPAPVLEPEPALIPTQVQEREAEALQPPASS
ncbi:MAG TPA: hypothetical protein V6D04_08170, partial [Candidatus Obscuribacterales bacterium]